MPRVPILAVDYAEPVLVVAQAFAFLLLALLLAEVSVSRSTSAGSARRGS